MPKRRAGSSPVPGTRFFFAKLTSALIYYCQKVWVVLFLSVMLLASAHAQLPQPTAEDPSGGCHEHHKTPRILGAFGTLLSGGPSERDR
jgi:hypothetical protein